MRTWGCEALASAVGPWGGAAGGPAARPGICAGVRRRVARHDARANWTLCAPHICANPFCNACDTVCMPKTLRAGTCNKICKP